PLYCDSEGNNLVTQFDKNDVESVGLVKFDFLGLSNLTTIDRALQTINRQQQKQGAALIDISEIPRDDAASYDLLKRGLTTAVFQLESGGMKKLIKNLKPDCFNDIIALVALYRPGPLESGMVDDYVDVKHKKKAAEYAHPLLEPILESTNGVILYQEQVMQIARELSGYTLGGADILRRAMGKKDAKEMAKQRDVFVGGALKNGVSDEIANYIFDLVDKFSGYGFNKSHSAAYALVAYQTAWLKAHHPAAFMAAVLSGDMDNTDKVVIAIDECLQMNLTIIPPSINVSDYRFTVNDDNALIYGLGAIKGVGENAILDMLDERERNGLFLNLHDLCQRVDLRKFNRRVLEALIRAGAFDEFDVNRAAHLAELPTILRVAEQHVRMKAVGQSDLFGLGEETSSQQTVSSTYSTVVEPWVETVRFSEEKAVLGLFLTGHPIDQYEKELKAIAPKNIARLLSELALNKSNIAVRVAGLAVDINIRQGKNGKFYGTMVLDDKTGRIEMKAQRESFEVNQAMFSAAFRDKLLIAEGILGMDSYLDMPSLRIERLYPIEQARKAIHIHWQSAEMSATESLDKFKQLLSEFQGGDTDITIDYYAAQSRAKVQLGSAWRVRATDDCLHQLKRWLGSAAIRVNY
ncbi:MAG TPA: DNA polymerase III subunit alpha, partial [Methylococcaceae bacterium]|nr:DNA polymerase III subunit alpha [Methylococcaceae bacterium]